MTSTNKLAIWRECVSEYYKQKGESYKVPKKGTPAYAAIKKEFERRTKCKKCKTSCTCSK